MKSIILITALLMSLNSWANVYPQSPSNEVLKEIAEANKAQALLDQFSGIDSFLAESSNVASFYEYDQTGYILMSADDYYGIAETMKNIVAENLPEETTLIIYTQSTNYNYQKNLYNHYSQFINPERLRILQVPSSGSNDFWTRDNLPLPAWENGDFTLVDARYYYNFEPDTFMSELFGAKLLKHNYFFEGGNFMVNSRGECIVVNRRKAYPGGTSDTGAIPDAIFAKNYGCSKLLRFKHLKGIGHADEVIKFLSDDIVVTDTEEYVERLEAEGYQVHLLPEPDRNYETYVNSLIVNDVIYVPTFNESGDQRAIDVYNNLNLGFRVVPVPSRRLATQGQGGIHCITMNYPNIPLKKLADGLGGKIVEF